MRLEEAASCFNNQTAETGDVNIEIPDDEGDAIPNNDQSRVLECANITNASLQVMTSDYVVIVVLQTMSLLCSYQWLVHVIRHGCQLCKYRTPVGTVISPTVLLSVAGTSSKTWLPGV